MQQARLQYLDIKPGGLRQVQRALASGRLIEVDQGPNDVAVKLREISDELHLHYDPYECVWIVMQRRHMPDGSVSEHLVTSAQEEFCDDRLVAAVRECCQPDYDLAGQLERAEAAGEKARGEQRAEAFGDASERLTFALTRDLGRHEIGQTAKSRAFVPRAFRPS